MCKVEEQTASQWDAAVIFTIIFLHSGSKIKILHLSDVQLMQFSGRVRGQEWGAKQTNKQKQKQADNRKAQLA